MKPASSPQPVRLHRPLVEAVAFAVKEVFYEKRQADRVIEGVLKSNPKWGARDRGFIAENTYEIVRWWRKLVYAWNREKFYPVHLKHLYQVLGAHFLLKFGELPPWEEFKETDPALVMKNLEAGNQFRAVRESIPDWLDELAENELGATWDAEIMALNMPANPVIRANSLKTTRKSLLKELEAAGIPTATKDNYPDALCILKKSNLFTSPLFHQGWFEMQDGSSQQVAPFLELTPGMQVIDACAGAGGKTLHIAALMENKGRILSMDTESYKLAELKRRSKRAGITIVETRTIESSKTIKRLEEKADRVLLDVPCSGLGILRRNPDSKWKLSAEFLDNVRATQALILEQYSQMVKPGGKLVYATCSILPSENTAQVEKFLVKNGGAWEWEAEQKIFSHTSGFDGFYMARLKRK